LSDLVIGEGVALDLRLAKLPSRTLAKVLDLLVQFGIALVLTIILAALSLAVDSAVTSALEIIMLVSIIVGYPALFETMTRGRTLGKMAMGLRVVRTDGGPVRFRHALVRALAGIFDFIVTAGVLGVVTSFCSKQGRRTGDFMAGTAVVRERTPDSGVSSAGMAALAMPYPLLGWAQSLDLSVLPDEVALAARQYLTRMYELRPEIAARMGYDLMVEVSKYIQRPAPYGTPPWAYLAAVTAERRARQMMKTEAEWRANWQRMQQAPPMRVPVPVPTPYARSQQYAQPNQPPQEAQPVQDMQPAQQQDAQQPAVQDAQPVYDAQSAEGARQSPAQDERPATPQPAPEAADNTFLPPN
jgi:uncharacterized RDD family membrane protein YckC